MQHGVPFSRGQLDFASMRLSLLFFRQRRVGIAKYTENIISALFQTAHQGNTSTMLLMATYLFGYIMLTNLQRPGAVKQMTRAYSSSWTSDIF